MRLVTKIGLLAWAGVVVLLAGCEKAGEAEFPTVDRQTAGIFLEPELRAVLPPGMELRPVYDRRSRSDQALGGVRQYALQRCGAILHHRLRPPGEKGPLQRYGTGRVPTGRDGRAGRRTAG